VTITFENDNDVIIYDLEMVIAFGRTIQQIFLAQCVWWIASVVGLKQRLVSDIDNLNGRVSVIKELRTVEGPSELQANGLNKTAIPVEVISPGKVVSPVPRNTPESQSQDRYLKECDQFIRESQKQQDNIGKLLEQFSGKDLLQRKQGVSAVPRDIQVVPQEDIELGYVHPDRRNQVQLSNDNLSDLDFEERTKLGISSTKKQRKEFNRQKSLSSQIKSGKVTKPITKKRRNYLQSIPKDSISEYLLNRK
jgi:hypothetical protein